MYEDAIDNVLYIGGKFFIAGNDTAPGIVKWDGSHFTSLGCGVNWDCTSLLAPNTYGGYVDAIIRYNGDIYVGGSIGLAGGMPVAGIARWNGFEWDSIGSTSKYGVVSCFEVINNELYVGGTFDSIGNIHANSLAKWNGVSWSDVYNLPNFWDPPIDANYVNAIALYKGEIYVGGNFGTYSVYDSLMDIAKYDGNSWVKVGGSLKGSLAGLGNMLVYKNELYVTGVFFKEDGNAGNNIQKWNGTQWSDVGGGTLLIDLSPGGQIRDAKIHNGELYVVGVFSYAGGVPARCVAKWDGAKWCGLGGHFDNNVDALGFCKDTLYIGGGFLSIDGDSMRFLAKWTGGSYTDTCSHTFGVQENLFKSNGISVFPNPATNYFIINSQNNNNQPKTVNIYSIEGVLVKQERFTSYEIRIETNEFSTGIYIVELKTKEGSFYNKVIITK